MNIDKYKKYKIKEQKTFNEFCFPKSYQLQQHQIFLSDYLFHENKINRLLFFH